MPLAEEGRHTVAGPKIQLKYPNRREVYHRPPKSLRPLAHRPPSTIPSRAALWSTQSRSEMTKKPLAYLRHLRLKNCAFMGTGSIGTLTVIDWIMTSEEALFGCASYSRSKKTRAGNVEAHGIRGHEFSDADVDGKRSYQHGIIACDSHGHGHADQAQSRIFGADLFKRPTKSLSSCGNFAVELREGGQTQHGA